MNVNEELLKKLNKDFRTYSDPDIVKLDNMVLNGILYSNKEDNVCGIPRGSVIQIAAASGTGKSTLALQIAKELCSKHYNVAYIDAEKGLNPSQMKGVGVYPYLNNLDDTKGGLFTIYKEYDCNEINNLLQRLAEDEIAQFVILDSLGAVDAGLYTGKDACNVNNPKVGGNTKSIKILMNTMNQYAISHTTTYIIINHTGTSIGTYIPTEKPKGGDAPIYLSDIVIMLTKKGSPLKIDEKPIAQLVNAEAKKSRYGQGFIKTPFYIAFGKGISMILTLEEMLRERKMLVITPGSSSNHLYINGEDIAFRGDPKNVIAEHYKELMNEFSWKDFALDSMVESTVLNVEFNKETEPTISKEDIEEMYDAAIIEEQDGIYFFRKEVDLDGQAISIYYNLADKKLYSEFNSEVSEVKNVNTANKQIEKYIKTLDKKESQDA